MIVLVVVADCVMSIWDSACWGTSLLYGMTRLQGWVPGRCLHSWWTVG